MKNVEQIEAQQAAERQERIQQEGADKRAEAQEAVEMAEAAAREAAAKAEAEKDKSDSLQNRLFADIKRPRRLRRVPRPRILCASNRARVILDIINKSNTIKLNKINQPELSTQVPTAEKLQTREVQKPLKEFQQDPVNFLSAKNTEHIDNTIPFSMASMQKGKRYGAAEEGEYAPEPIFHYHIDKTYGLSSHCSSASHEKDSNDGSVCQECWYFKGGNKISRCDERHYRRSPVK